MVKHLLALKVHDLQEVLFRFLLSIYGGSRTLSLVLGGYLTFQAKLERVSTSRPKAVDLQKVPDFLGS